MKIFNSQDGDSSRQKDRYKFFYIEQFYITAISIYFLGDYKSL